MDNSPPRIYSIIATYNGSETICECLQSLQQSRQTVKIIVVENASTDATSALILGFPNVIYLPQERNLGFGRANNVGLKYALDHNADYVFLLNQDALVKPDTIEKLLQVASRQSEFGILSPMQLDGQGLKIDEKFQRWIFRGAPQVLSDSFFNQLLDCYELPFLPAASWLLSINCIRQVGGFDDLFFMYGEDDDYCFRTRLHGYKIGLVPDSIVFHKRINSKPGKSGWAAIHKNANRKISGIMSTLKATPRSFFIEMLLQGIDHLAQILKAIVKFEFGELLVLLVSGLKIAPILPKIWIHRKQSLQNSAYLD